MNTLSVSEGFVVMEYERSEAVLVGRELEFKFPLYLPIHMILLSYQTLRIMCPHCRKNREALYVVESKIQVLYLYYS